MLLVPLVTPLSPDPFPSELLPVEVAVAVLEVLGLSVASGEVENSSDDEAVLDSDGVGVPFVASVVVEEGSPGDVVVSAGVEVVASVEGASLVTGVAGSAGSGVAGVAGSGVAGVAGSIVGVCTAAGLVVSTAGGVVSGAGVATGA